MTFDPTSVFKSHVQLYPRIIVSKSNVNTVLFKNLHQKVNDPKWPLRGFHPTSVALFMLEWTIITMS